MSSTHDTCRRCGAGVSENTDICPNCGAAIRKSAGKIVCSHCHHRASAYLTICPHCGRKLNPWRPYRAIATVTVLVLLLLWLNFAGGWGTVSKVGTGLVALVPPPATEAPIPTTTPTSEPIPTEAVVAVVPTSTPLEPAPAETPVPPTDTPVPTATTPSDTPEPTADPSLYKVRVGDTPIGIAGKFDISVAELLAFNKIKDPTSLRIGQEIRIPQPEPTETPTPEPTSPPTLAVTSGSNENGTPLPTPRTTQQPAPTATAVPEPTATPTPKNPGIYIVKSGDTLSGIALAVQRSVEVLMAFNNIKNPTSLRVNQEIRIPKAKYTPPTPTPKKPTRTPTPTPTATPSITLSAPMPINPGDGSSFQGANALIMLSWNNPDGLPDGVQNIVQIGIKVGEGAVEWRLVEAVGRKTEFRVPEWLHGQAPQEFSRTYFWRVHAASLVGAAGDIAASSPVSPPSDQRQFQWN